MRQLIPLVAATGLTAACATSYAYHYEPFPLEVHVQEGEETPPVARVMIAALGGVRIEEEGAPVRFEERFRVRIENRTDVPVALDSAELALVDGDLRSFGPARTEPESPAPIAPGEEGLLEVFVAFPDGVDPDALNLDRLNLRWGLVVEDQHHLIGSNFVRVRPRPAALDDPWFRPSWGVSVGLHTSP